MLRKALWGGMAAVAGLAVAEIGLRVLVPRERLLLEWERPNGLISTTEDGGVVTRPGMKEERYDGPYPWRVALDATGFREDTDVTREPAPGVYRILALGDSWMFGFSVDQGHTIPQVLEARLPERMGRPVEVVNAGVFGSCAFDMLAHYRELVDTYAFDGVLLGQPHNGARMDRVASERAAWYRSAARGPAFDLRLYLGLRRILAPLRTPAWAEPLTGDSREAQIADLKVLADDAHKRGKKVWLAELPNDMGQAMAGFTGSPEWRNGLGLPAGGHALAERACWGFEDLGHPSEAGAEAIATALVEVIATDRTVPVATTPRCSDSAAAGPGKPGW